MQVWTSIGASTKSSVDKKHPVFPVGNMLPFVLVTVLFFLWGMSNNLTDILVQQFKKSLELSQFSAHDGPVARRGEGAVLAGGGSR